MAVIVTTENPTGLLDALRTAIADGKLDTWTMDQDGDLTHSPPQWVHKAWLRPKVNAGNLTFYILAPQGTTMSVSTYGIYHGRFIECLLNHFDKLFSSARATSLPITGDIVRTA